MSDFETDEELKAYLSCAFDLDQYMLDTMGREELESLLVSMNESMSIPQAVAANHSDNASDASDYIMPPSPPTYDNEVEDDTTAMNAGDVGAGPTNDGDESVINSFMDVTGADRESAKAFLEAIGYDLDTAISLYLENEQPAQQQHPVIQNPFGGGGGGVHRTTFSTDSFGSSGIMGGMGGFGSHTRFRANHGDEDDEQNEMAADDQDHAQQFLARMRAPRLNAIAGGGDAGVAGGTAPDDVNMQGMGNMNQQLRQFMAAHGIHAPMGDDDDDDEYGMGQQQQGPMYDEDGVRRPDPVRQQRLVSGGGMYRQTSDDALARSEDPTVDWMFPPPRHISYIGTLEQARSLANSEKRWLLVNIQSHTEFAAQLLNRDVWTNETIESLCRTSFLFWQRGHTCRDGRDYMSMYHVSDDELPHIAFIDPRTGAKVLALTGLMEASDLAIRMIEFSESHPLTAAPTPAVRSAAESPSAHVFGSAIASAGASTTSTSIAPSPTTVPAAIPMSEVQSSSSSAGIAAVEPVPVAAAVHDYGPVPSEPVEGEADVVRVSIKLIGGKSIVRKYRASDPVRVLFAVVNGDLLQQASSEGGRMPSCDFDIMTRFPTTSLLTCLDQSLAECKLAGSNVIVKAL